MIFRNIARAFALVGLALSINLAQAGTHVWIPLADPQGYGTLSTVVVIGERVNWGAGYFDNDKFAPDNDIGYYGGSSLGQAIAGAKERALDFGQRLQKPFCQFANQGRDWWQ